MIYGMAKPQILVSGQQYPRKESIPVQGPKWVGYFDVRFQFCDCDWHRVRCSRSSRATCGLRHNTLLWCLRRRSERWLRLLALFLAKTRYSAKTALKNYQLLIYGDSFVLYCVVLYCIVFYFIVLYCVLLYSIVLYYIILYYSVLCCIVLCCIVWCCVVLYFIVLCCIAW